MSKSEVEKTCALRQAQRPKGKQMRRLVKNKIPPCSYNYITKNLYYFKERPSDYSECNNQMLYNCHEYLKRIAWGVPIEIER